MTTRTLVYTPDISLTDLLSANGFRVTTCHPGLTTLTIKSRLPVSRNLIRLYLALPWKPPGETNAASGRTAIVTPVELLRSWLQAHRTLQILLVVIFGILLFSATADEPFQLDNIDLPAVARATSVSGVPIYYRGEENPQLTGLYHPPLYIYALAAWIALLGFGEVPVRMFGIACALYCRRVSCLQLCRHCSGASMLNR